MTEFPEYFFYIYNDEGTILEVGSFKEIYNNFILVNEGKYLSPNSLSIKEYMEKLASANYLEIEKFESINYNEVRYNKDRISKKLLKYLKENIPENKLTWF